MPSSRSARTTTSGRLRKPVLAYDPDVENSKDQWRRRDAGEDGSVRAGGSNNNSSSTSPSPAKQRKLQQGRQDTRSSRSSAGERAERPPAESPLRSSRRATQAPQAYDPEKEASRPQFAGSRQASPHSSASSSASEEEGNGEEKEEKHDAPPRERGRQRGGASDGGWTAQEDSELRQMVAESGARDWSRKAAEFSSARSASSLKHRWYRTQSKQQQQQQQQQQPSSLPPPPQNGKSSGPKSSPEKRVGRQPEQEPQSCSSKRGRARQASSASGMPAKRSRGGPSSRPELASSKDAAAEEPKPAVVVKSRSGRVAQAPKPYDPEVEASRPQLAAVGKQQQPQVHEEKRPDALDRGRADKHTEADEATEAVAAAAAAAVSPAKVPAPKGSSAYRGVSFNKASGKWRADIKGRDRPRYLGLFQHEKEAARAFDQAARQLNRPSAELNFPDRQSSESDESTERGAKVPGSSTGGAAARSTTGSAPQRSSKRTSDGGPSSVEAFIRSARGPNILRKVKAPVPAETCDVAEYQARCPLPYDSSSLQWNRRNLFTKRKSRNVEDVYCYCGQNLQGPKDHSVQCDSCENWFHVGCTDEVPGPTGYLPFQLNYSFTCRRCNFAPCDKHSMARCRACAPRESFRLTKSSWLQTVLSAQSHLAWRTQRDAFKVAEICQFIDDHWSLLCLDEKKASADSEDEDSTSAALEVVPKSRKEDKWKNSLNSYWTTHQAKYFTQPQRGYWGLRESHADDGGPCLQPLRMFRGPRMPIPSEPEKPKAERVKPEKVKPEKGKSKKDTSQGPDGGRRGASSSTSASQYRGVSWNKNGKWEARIGNAGRHQYLGSFTDEAEAARAYDKMAKQLRGPTAVLNFPIAQSSATTAQAAGRGSNASSSSRFRGVSWIKARSKWGAKITHGGKPVHLGTYDDEEDAARAVDSALREMKGAATELNFPTTRESAHISNSRSAAGSIDSGASPTGSDTAAWDDESDVYDSSKYRGVSWSKATKQWQAQINVNGGKQRRLGTFAKEKDAAQAFDEAAREIRGSAAVLNFPQTVVELHSAGLAQDAAILLPPAGDAVGSTGCPPSSEPPPPLKHAWLRSSLNPKSQEQSEEDSMEVIAWVKAAADRLLPPNPVLDDEHAQNQLDDSATTHTEDWWQENGSVAEMDLDTSDAWGAPALSWDDGSVQEAPAETTGSQSSRFKGVSWRRACGGRRGKWRCEIRVDGKAKSLGAFVNEVDAARAYDEAARVLRGPDAELNFPNAGEKSHFDNHKRNQAGSSKSSQQARSSPVTRPEWMSAICVDRSIPGEALTFHASVAPAAATTTSSHESVQHMSGAENQLSAPQGTKSATEEICGSVADETAVSKATADNLPVCLAGILTKKTESTSAESISAASEATSEGVHTVVEGILALLERGPVHACS